jgi:hypothetical protein
MKKVLIYLLVPSSFSLQAGEISAYEQALINGQGVTISGFTGKGKQVIDEANERFMTLGLNSEPKPEYYNGRHRWNTPALPCNPRDPYCKGVGEMPIVEPTPIPEPSSLALFGLAVFGLFARRLLRTNAKHKC